MSFPDTWQLPSADDIDPDSLEYLLAPKRLRGDAPWVRIVRDPEPVARIGPEMIRLQAKLEALVGQLEIFTNKLAKSNHELGFARAQIAERDKQLELQAEYRVRAAVAIMSDLEKERLVRRIAELEELVVALVADEAKRPALAETPSPQAPETLIAPAAGHMPAVDQMPAAGQRNRGLERMLSRHSAEERGFDLPLMPITYFLVVAFAAMVMLTILL
jgi:hypothetical protein